MTAPASNTPPDSSFAFAFTPEDFQTIAQVLYADSGIALTETKAPLVYGRLVKNLRALGLESFKDYCALIGSHDGIDERQRMLAALTTNVTRFMREPHHFDALRTTTLPPLLEKAKRGGRVRIWSAACSSGQEPFSIAMTVLGLMRDAHNKDVRILATDIDPGMVAAGLAGVYSDEELTEVPKAERLKWFEQSAAGSGGKCWSACESMRELVSFRRLNLVGEWPMKGLFHVIFCRNVAIYFDQATQSKLWARFAASIEPGGLLCIGHSERLSGPAKDLFDMVGPTMYIRREKRA